MLLHLISLLLVGFVAVFSAYIIVTKPTDYVETIYYCHTNQAPETIIQACAEPLEVSGISDDSRHLNPIMRAQAYKTNGNDDPTFAGRLGNLHRVHSKQHELTLQVNQKFAELKPNKVEIYLDIGAADLQRSSI